MQPLDPQYSAEAIAALQDWRQRQQQIQEIRQVVQQSFEAAKRRRRSPLREAELLQVRVKGV